VFAKECANIDLNSSVLDNKVADKRSELNFHFIMGMIKHQSYQKQISLKIEKEAAENKNKKNGICAPIEEEEDNLITYREYIKAIKSLKKLYKKLLPRTLGFKDVLLTKRTEM
jgi:hypothetical protein